MLKSLPVTGSRPYDVTLGKSLFDDVAHALGDRVQKALIIHSGTVGGFAERLRETLAKDVPEVLLAEVPDAEAAKRVEVAAFCWQIMGQADFTRTDAVIGLGGGAVTDLAGFVAATWLRGVPLIQIPTTILGMVDAAVGGKTGINTAEGKNLVGAFYAPRAVFADLELLQTLPRNEILTGFAEVAKCGFIADTTILDVIEADVDQATNPDSAEFFDVVARAIAVKANIVSEDFTEQGKREFLNYGHTLGHAIEHAERYTWRHGAAISIGMVYAAELSHLTGALDEQSVQRHRRVLNLLSLPTSYDADRWPSLLATMQRDKKSRAGMLRFVVLDAIGKPSILAGADESLLYLAYQEVSR